jgi:hypothetical protein
VVRAANLTIRDLRSTSDGARGIPRLNPDRLYANQRLPPLLSLARHPGTVDGAPDGGLAIAMSMPSPPHCNNWPGILSSNPRPILSPTTHQSSLVIPIILWVSAPEETARRRGHPRRAIAGKESYTNTERWRARSVVYRGGRRVGAARDSALDSTHAQQGIQHRAPTILHNSLHDVVGERNRREGGLLLILRSRHATRRSHPRGLPAAQRWRR